MINIIATLIAAAALNSPSQLPQEQTTSSTQEAVVADIASMTLNNVLKKQKRFMKKALIMNMGSQKPLIVL